MQTPSSQLAERWTTAEGARLRAEVMKAVAGNSVLDSIQGLERVNGLWDLRGISFPENTQWRNVHWTDVDMSDAIAERQRWDGCIFERILLHATDLAGTADKGSLYTDIYSKYGDFRGMGLGTPTGASKETRFQRCRFEKVNLSGVGYWYTWFEDVEFLGCRFGSRTDFWGSHFVRCLFTGTLRDICFRGRFGCPVTVEQHQTR